MTTFALKNFNIMMKNLFICFAALLLAVPAVSQEKAVVKTLRTDSDWAGHKRYAEANASLRERPAVVFMGNSITEFWEKRHPEYFSGHNFVCRGISGQVSSQMLCRFRADVLDLRPRAVVILAGTNDIALNNGAIEPRHIADNIFSMAELAHAHGIKVIIAAVLPAARYGWRPEVTDSRERIAELNALLRDYAAAERFVWVDFTDRLSDADGGLDGRYTKDGVHPTLEGYMAMEEVMAPVLKKYMK